MPEDAVRSETVSRGISLQFAICREIFRNCRESRSYFLPSFLIISRPSKEFSRPKEQGTFLALQGKEQGTFFVLQGGAALELRMRLARAGTDCLVGQQVRLAPPSRRGRRSGPIMVIVQNPAELAAGGVRTSDTKEKTLQDLNLPLPSRSLLTRDLGRLFSAQANPICGGDELRHRGRVSNPQRPRPTAPAKAITATPKSFRWSIAAIMN